MAASVKSSSMNQRATFVIFIALYAFSILSANGQKAAATTIGKKSFLSFGIKIGKCMEDLRLVFEMSLIM